MSDDTANHRLVDQDPETDDTLPVWDGRPIGDVPPLDNPPF